MAEEMSQNPERHKKSKGGENPYLFAAEQLGARQEFEKKVHEYLVGPKTPEDYIALCMWEVEAFNKAFKEKNGRLPLPGDIEKLLPESELTQAAIELIPKLKNLGTRLAVVSSGFNYLVQPNARALGIDEDNVYANDLKYGDEEQGLTNVEVNVSGDKVTTLELVSTNFNSLGIDRDKIAYIDDNKWGEKGMSSILSNGGHVFYLGNDNEKDEPLLMEDMMRKHSNFYEIKSLTDIASHSSVVGDKIKGMIFDADGTLIDTK